MKNAMVNNVAVNNVQRDRSHFNFDHDVNTTASLGTIQPLGFMDMLPHDKVSFSPKTLVRAGAMVVPSWAKFRWNLDAAFVPIHSVFPNYDYFVSGAYKRGASGKLSIGTLPYITTAQLTVMCLAGAKVSVWMSDAPTSSVLPALYVKVTKDSPQSFKDVIDAVKQPNYFRVADGSQIHPLFPSHRGLIFNGSAFWKNAIFFDNASGIRDFWIPIGNKAGTPNTAERFEDIYYGNEDVSPSNADFVVETVATTGSYNRQFAFCFKLSDKGKLFAKLLRGLGYNLDLRASTIEDRVSLLPLLAWYRAYFKFNGIERLRNWESTYCHQLIHYIENTGDSSCNFTLGSDNWVIAYAGSNYNAFVNFVFNELYDSFYPTENYNFVSAHRADITERASAGSYEGGTYSTEIRYDLVLAVNKAINSIESYTADGVVSHSDAVNDAENTEHSIDISTGIFDTAKIAGRKITQGDRALTATTIEALKRLQRMTSKHDVLGQNVRSLLKAFGVDAYDDEEYCETLGHRSFDLDISEVTSLADTYENSVGEGGRYLGEQAGKSVTQGDDSYSRPIVCETDKRGFFIVMGGVLPVSGYVNKADDHHYMVTRDSQYNKELEGLGYDATRFERLFGDLHVASKETTAKKHCFGFVPRWSGLKVMHNVQNGDFNRPSTSEALLPYTSDRNIRLLQPNGEVTYQDENKIFVSTHYLQANGFEKLPIAGKEWAYTYKYGYMGWLQRMFVNYDAHGIRKLYGFLLDSDINEWTVEQPDNFIVHMRINMSLNSEMLPIADTYQTQDDSAKANETLNLS